MNGLISLWINNKGQYRLNVWRPNGDLACMKGYDSAIEARKDFKSSVACNKGYEVRDKAAQPKQTSP